MSMITWILRCGVAPAFLVLPGCFMAPIPPLTTPINPESSAKIRLFQSSAWIDLFIDETCYPAQRSIWGRSIDEGQITGEVVSLRPEAPLRHYEQPDGTLGIPATEDMKPYYQELLIPAGKPITVEMMIGTQFLRCGPVRGTFTPEHGKFYDAAMGAERNQCFPRIRELTEVSPGRALAHEVPLKPAFPCPVTRPPGH